MRLPEILDCTIRDGGYVNNWRFEPAMVREVYRAASKAGVDYVELGYHSSPRFHDPEKFGLWRFTPEAALRQVCEGIQGAKPCLMVDSGKLDMEALPPRRDSLVDLIRVAVHRDRIDQALGELGALRDLGYRTSLQLMGYATFSDQERGDLKHRLQGAPLDYVYVGDSYGSIFPDQIAGFLEPLQAIGGFKVGFHPHNQLQMAFANSLEAVKRGVDMLDATIFGIGRAAGNLPLEALVAYLQFRWPDRFSVLPLLSLIDRYFIKLKQDLPWGYQLPYMLSGLLNIHPDYPRHLMERREHAIEDIWKGLQVVAEYAGVGFSRELLDRLVASGLVQSSLNGHAKLSLWGAAPAEESPPQPVAYRERHPGRDFLVLANGPSLSAYADKIRRFIAKHDPVVLGANHLAGLFAPHYHAFSNKRRFLDYIGEVDPASRLLLGANFDEAFIRDHTKRDFEWLVFVDRLADFAIQDGVVMANCRTVSVLLCAVAAVMGARRVFVAGMDGYVGRPLGDGVHFYAEQDETQNLEVTMDKHRQCMFYLKAINEHLQANGQEGLHILTPTAYAEHYKGISNYL